MKRAAEPHVRWVEDRLARTVAFNVGSRYMTLASELLLGLFMLPFNMRHLGTSEYGLWMLAASIVAYFPILDLGFGGAMERFVAHNRAQRNPTAINEIASTLLVIFTAIGAAAFGVVALIAWNLGAWFDLGAGQARTGSLVMLLVGAQFAFGLPFAVFGAIVNAFQRQYLNAAVGSVIGLSVAAVNIAVVLSGGSLVQLVAATTATRMIGFLAYRLNAYRVFPLLRTRLSLFRLNRVKELSSFSVYMLIQDLSVKVNYATDPIVIAAAMMTGAVAVWTVAQRLADVVLQLTNQLNCVLFPIVVDADSSRRDDRLRDLLVQGTRLSLASALPVGGSLALLAHPVVIAWTGPALAEAVAIVPLLAVVVIVRVGAWTASTVLQGAGRHRLVALSNAVAAVVNVLLSVLLIRLYGLPGVAVATLIPLTVRAVTVIIPAACQRVGMSLSSFAALAVWPAAWPAVVALGGLALVRDPLAASLGYALVHGAATAAVYAALFLGIAIGRQDRARYLGKLRMIANRPALEAA